MMWWIVVVLNSQNVDPSPVSGGESSLGPSAICKRKRRLLERKGREDSASQVLGEIVSSCVQYCWFGPIF